MAKTIHEQFSTSLAIKEMQIKTTLSKSPHHSYSSSNRNESCSNRNKSWNVGKDEEEKEHL
jgi:hypothetical protein